MLETILLFSRWKTLNSLHQTAYMPINSFCMRPSFINSGPSLTVPGYGIHPAAGIFYRIFPDIPSSQLDKHVVERTSSHTHTFHIFNYGKNLRQMQISLFCDYLHCA